MDQAFTINGGSGAGTINIQFIAYGSSYSLSYVDTLVGAIDNILNNGGNTKPLSPDSVNAYFPGAQLDGVPTIYQLKPNAVTVSSQTFDIESSGYVIDSVGGAVVINTDNGGGDSILVVGTSEKTTVNTFGSDNLVVFINGDNVFNGSTTGTDETVVGGSGNDVINTGFGSTTVNAGIGHDLITLNDTASSAFNDFAYLDTGYDSVIADGTGDFVLATTEFASVVAGSGEMTGSALTVVLLPNNDGTANGFDTVVGGAGYLTVVDGSSANTITGGDGGLTFIGAAGISATINLGNGDALIFGASDDTVTIGNIAGENGAAAVIAGTGSEMLSGALATGNLTLYGAMQADSTGASDTLIGGTGNDTLVAGAGSETLTGGAGANTFLIDAMGAANANITISDFAGDDSVAFGNFTDDQVSAALSGGQEVAGNFVVTFSDTSTTVTFTGVTSETQLTGHIITF